MSQDPPNRDWVVMACSVCGQPWDDWHESRRTLAVWTTSCKWDRRISEWWRGLGWRSAN